MRMMGSSGIWELFVPDIEAGARYKFEIVGADGRLVLKTDPLAFATENPPKNDCIVYESKHEWTDSEWMARRNELDHNQGPMSIYEVHLGSWRRSPDGDVLGYRDAGIQLAEYCRVMGFTHVEFMPLAEHPFYRIVGLSGLQLLRPHPRYGDPDDFKAMIDSLHNEGIGVLIDWVPAHFPKDDWALARFDGTPLYEHADPRKGEHPDWGTLIFNYGRNEVRNFLIANALFWIEELPRRRSPRRRRCLHALSGLLTRGRRMGP